MSVAPNRVPDPEPSSFVELLRRRALDRAGRGGFTYQGDDGRGVASLDFAGLDFRARAIAARLQHGDLTGQVAVLLYPPGLDFLPAFFGCLYAGVIPAPAYPPRSNRPSSRLQALFADARPAAVLGGSALLDGLDAASGPIGSIEGIARVATDLVPDALSGSWREGAIDPNATAFLQYTSGSTARPKGVEITHANLVANSAAIRRAFGADGSSRGVFWLPLYHDMGLIGGILQTIHCGGSSTLLAPASFLQRPYRWLEAISRTGATISGGPNFAYDLCARKITDEQKATLDLSRWRVAFNGAEPIHPETLDRFAAAFEPCGFRPEAFLPCYGLAEGTLLVASGTPERAPVVLEVDGRTLAGGRAVAAMPGQGEARRLVGSGRAAEGHSVAIADPVGLGRQPDGAVGEIWVAGPSVARGYRGQVEATRASFSATLAGDPAAGPHLRTGDLGFLRDGELFVAGRIKDLIIVRGRNVYPQDVEWTVGRSHPSLAPESSAVFAVEGAEGMASGLVVVQEAGRREKDPDPVLAAIRAAVAVEHELELLEIVLIRPLTLPKTSSGKVQRHEARAAYLAGTLDRVASWSSVAAEPARPAGPTPGTPPARSRAEVAAWLAARLAGPLGVTVEEVDPTRPFAEFGLGSLRAVEMAAEMERWLGRPLSPTLLYDHPTIEALAAALADGGVTPRPAAAEVSRAREDDRVAIVGIGCRFPGARGPGAFWDLLAGGVDAVGELPEGRRADFGGPGSHRAGFLDAVDRFDAPFFGISPREAAEVDPQQRLLLEVAWEAMEDAGIAADRLAGDRVGVFVGIATNDYGRLRGRDRGQERGGEAYSLTGNAASIAANRISYAFDFRGPSLAVDTACSSSLVAIHLACRALNAREATLALAGGVNLILDAEVFERFGAAGFLAPDGRCKPFDAAADGYARGEGAALVALKPLARALADGDPIYAVIRGGAINQDGRSNGLTAPSADAQEAVLRDAYRSAGIDPARVEYVEAHGTGTLLGDPIEAAALGRVLAPGRVEGAPCRIGSVKANIGHLEAAAGVAGVIKVALALRHHAIPPSLHFRDPNPRIAFEGLGLEVARDRSAWPAHAAPRIAGVSSFGFGGTNAHLVLESFDAAPVGVVEAPGSARILPISARSPEALRALARSYRSSLAGGAALADLAAAAARGRAMLEYRLAVVAGSTAEALRLLDAAAAGRGRGGLASGRKPPGRARKLALVFSGQGVQWVGMGRDLLAAEPRFGAAFDAVDRIVRDLAGWSPRAELEASASATRIFDPEFAQPVQFAVHLALAALLRSWGVEPGAVVGHSLGEISAACVAGALAVEDAARLVVARGRLTHRELGRGRTVAVGLGPDEATRVVAGSGGRLALAAINGPRSAAISGDPAAIADLVESLLAAGTYAIPLEVDVAYHGPGMDRLAVELRDAVAGLAPAASTIPLVSTVTGGPIDGRDLTPDHWARNLRETVRFRDAVDHLAGAGFDLFVEVGPHPTLVGAIGEILRDRGRDGLALGSLRRGLDGPTALRRSIAGLFAQGWPIAWDQVAPARRPAALPSYPWQGERHWFAAAPARPEPAPAHHGSGNGNGHRNGNGNGNGNGHHRPVEASPEVISGSDLALHEVAWVPLGRPEADAASGERPGRWLIFADGAGVARSIRIGLEAEGADCLTVIRRGEGTDEGTGDLAWTPGDRSDLDRLLDGVEGAGSGPIGGVIFGWPLDEKGGEAEGPATEADGLALLCDSALALIRALGERRLSARVWLLTAGAQPVGPSPAVVRPSQAAIWGLGRSIALGSPRSWGGLIDLDPAGPAADPSLAVARILRPDGEDQVALRSGLAFGARLVRATEPRPAAPVVMHPDGTYLVTGGLGELGLAAARWLVDRGAKRVVLLGRRGLPPRGSWDDLAPDQAPSRIIEAVRAMERLGVTVVVVPADLADAHRMATLFERLAGLLPPIRGIIHAAGVLEAAERGAVADVLRPKVAGTWNLYRLTRSTPLDFFACFSSAAATFGAREAGYAAANAFLDGFARWAGDRGVPALSLAWGPWASGGMAADRARGHRSLGIEPLAADRAFGLLGAILGGPARHVVAAEFDWFTFRMVARAGGRGRFLEAIEERPTPAAAEATPAASFRDRWRLEPPDRRRPEIVRYFRDRVAGVLRLDPVRVDPERPLDAMGLDSLMAIELKGHVEADLGTELPLTSLLDGPTIHQLADLAAEQWDAPASAATTAGPIEALPPVGLDEHPLSIGQRALWGLHRRMPDDPSYNMAGAARLRVALDVAALRRAIAALVERHPTLRTTFHEVDGRPIQRVIPATSPAFGVVDASGWGEGRLREEIRGEALRPFDLAAAPPFRTTLFSTAEADHVLVFSAHHVVGDFWSIAILLEELGPLYRAERGGPAADLAPPAVRYVDFVRWQAALLAGPEGDRLRGYWAGQLAPPLPEPELPTDHPRPAVRDHRGGSRSIRIDAETVRPLAELAASRGASLYVATLAAFGTLIGRLAGVDDLIVGSPVAGRGRAGLDGVVGYFANPLPIRVDLAGPSGFEGVLDRVRRAVLDGLDHQDLPLAEMVDRFATGRSAGASPLFSAFFAYQKAQRLDAEGLTPFVLRQGGAKLDLAGLPMESVALDLGTSQFDLTLSVVESDGGLVASLEYRADLFEPDTAGRILDRYRTLLGAIARDPSRPVADLPILPESERALVVDAWNATDAPFPGETPVHRLFEGRAARTPDAVAVAHGGRLLTYRDLNDRANRLAARLRGLGVGPESRVGLGVERSEAMIVGILGILKAGGAYVPLDPNYPARRLAFLATDASIAVLVTDARSLPRLPEGDAPVVLIEESGAEGGPAPDLPGGARSCHAAYVIYTSGSTGRPKGVTVSHRNLAQSTAARFDYYPGEVGAFLLLASFSHDTSVAGIFWTLCQGGRLVIPRQGEHTDPEVLSRLVLEHGVTHWNSVPSLFRVLLAEMPPGRLGSLRVVFFGGEACPPDLPVLARERLPLASIHNEYGPTEATVWCVAHPCGPDDPAGRPIPIGRPIANARSYVLDARCRPAPIGVAGELWIGGEGVARGYLGRPGLTADRFAPDPFGPRPGGRMYRTGDLARWRADGRLEFLGRLDDQVKVRGHRIELGEVDAALLDHPGIGDVAAVAAEYRPGDHRLVAYFIPAAEPAPEPGELRRWLKRRLPDSHVPTYFVPVAEFPRSPNGKLDRKALPDPFEAPEAAGAAGPRQGPRDDAERAVARVAAEVLGRDGFGIHDDFFDLGIDSILAIQLVSRLRQAGLRVDPGQVFEHPTVEGLAALAVASAPEARPGPAGPADGEYAASPMQEGMLFHSGQAAGSGLYVQQFTAPIERALDLPAFEDAWRQVFDRHAVLRTAFLPDDRGRPRQHVRRRVELPLRVLDWSGLDPDALADRLDDFLRLDRRSGFDPAAAPLLRIALIRTGKASSRLVLSNHHALMDGWCVPILLGEVLACYEAAVAGRRADLPPPRPYAGYIHWLRSVDGAEAERFWRATLRDVRAATPLPPPSGRPDRREGAGEGEGGVRRLRLDAEATLRLAAMARSRRLTLGTTVQGAWALLLARYSGRDEVVFGVTVAGRPADLPGSERMVGLFINTLPARVALDEARPVAGWLGEVQAHLVDLRRHETTPLVAIQGWSGVPRGRPLFESIVVFENYPDDQAARDRADRLGVGPIEALERTSYPLALTAIPGHRLELAIGFDRARYDDRSVDRLLDQLAGILAAMADGPGRPLGEIRLGDGADPASPPTEGRDGSDPDRLDRLSDEEVEALIVALSSEGGPSS